MGFKEAVRTCFSKYFTLKGRAPRSEYWWFILFQYLVLIDMVAIMVMIAGGLEQLGDDVMSGAMGTGFIVLAILFVIVFIALFIPAITVQVRRFHDRDLSGWWVLAAMILGQIPYIGFVVSIAVLVVTVMKGTEGDNRFGPDPLQVQNSADVFA